MVGEVLSFNEEDTAPKFLNSYLEKGALLSTYVDVMAKKWLQNEIRKTMWKRDYS